MVVRSVGVFGASPIVVAYLSVRKRTVGEDGAWDLGTKLSAKACGLRDGRVGTPTPLTLAAHCHRSAPHSPRLQALASDFWPVLSGSIVRTGQNSDRKVWAVLVVRSVGVLGASPILVACFGVRKRTVGECGAWDLGAKLSAKTRDLRNGWGMVSVVGLVGVFGASPIVVACFGVRERTVGECGAWVLGMKLSAKTCDLRSGHDE